MSLVSACSQALALIQKPQITSLTETSLEAQYCQLFAETLLEEMGDWTVWPSLIKRTVLAGATNDRPAEWLYAYALPSDFGEPIAVRRVENDLQVAHEIAGPVTLPDQDRRNLGFIIEGGVIYSNVKTATLVYTRKQMTASDWTPLMRRAFIDEMAVRLASPVGKFSAARIERLERKAMQTKMEAMADAQNKTPRQAPNHTTMAEYAREGLFE